MQRRDFVKLGSMLAATTATSGSIQAENIAIGKSARPVDFLHDGLLLAPREYANLLMKLADEGKIKPDPIGRKCGRF